MVKRHHETQTQTQPKKQTNINELEQLVGRLQQEKEEFQLKLKEADSNTEKLQQNIQREQARYTQKKKKKQE